ncbi:DNA ligase [Tetrabaena socialis]|uniref:DNA ligase n=1 Tax=Tetrabaena socialis TaxID=47790 RepID=A0A2J7ZMV1_9CHLO|nr:DNA ligase [Tetrabaena socialis]|eukprot:PNH01587.1 DNA ligase [Tetrabaena socialis]
MLAHEFTPQRDAKLRYPCFVQPKLDGVRMLVSWTSRASFSMESRNGTSFDHLLPIFTTDLTALKKSLPASVSSLDGELYIHGEPFQDIVSMVRNRSVPDTAKDLQYHVYDLIDEDRAMSFKERTELLRSAFRSTKGCRRVKEVAVKEVGSRQAIEVALDEAEHDGYEGIMIRASTGTYELGKRSSNLLKYKRFSTDEFTIVSYREATGRDRGTPIFECATPSGALFSARPVGTLAARARLFDTASEQVGKAMTVKFQGLSRSGIPRFPVALGVRDYE